MFPIKVDPLFSEEPKLFAYTLPTTIEREKAQIGDMVKLFLQLKAYVRPRPIWYEVTSISQNEEKRIFTGKIWRNYSLEKQGRFPVLEFDSTHIYRLPLSRPEAQNPLFDPVYRDTKAIA